MCENSEGLANAESEVLAELDDDYVGLWTLIKVVKTHFQDADDKAIRNLTLHLVRRLLDDDSVIAGSPTTDWSDFVRWYLSSQETVDRVSQEWDRLGREPNVWEIVWFSRRGASESPT